MGFSLPSYDFNDPSEPSTFTDHDHDHDHSSFAEQKQHLLSHSDFRLDTTALTAELNGPKRPTPPLYQPSHALTFVKIRNARIACLVLNFVPMLLPVIGPAGTIAPLVPLSISSSFVLMFLLGMLLSFHKFQKLGFERDRRSLCVGDRRVVVLVDGEGEEKAKGKMVWRIEPRRAEDDFDGWLEGKTVTAVVDGFCVVLMLGNVILAMMVGDNAQTARKVVIVTRVISILLQVYAGYTRFSLMF